MTAATTTNHEFDPSDPDEDDAPADTCRQCGVLHGDHPTAAATTTLTEFLLARIAEDEASLPSGHDCWYEPERYWAECEAKRRIVEDAQHFIPVEGSMAEAALMRLAAIYADHPDYREEWA